MGKVIHILEDDNEPPKEDLDLVTGPIHDGEDVRQREDETPSEWFERCFERIH